MIDTPVGGSVQATTNVAVPLTSGLAIATWLVQPVWPPPESVLILIVGLLSPLGHLVGRAIYRKIAALAGEPDDAKPDVDPPKGATVS